MPRTPVLAGLVCAAIGIAFTGCGGDNAKLQKKTFKIDERDTNELAFVDNAPKSKGRIGRQGPKLSRGDQVGFRRDLIRDKKDVGDLIARCFVLTAGSGRFDKADVECTGVYELPEGKLFGSVGGRDAVGSGIKGSVTGGTEDYEGATGSVSSPASDSNVTHDTFKIFVPKD